MESSFLILNSRNIFASKNPGFSRGFRAGIAQKSAQSADMNFSVQYKALKPYDTFQE
jgi:hypothetical protein